ncbi:MAG: NAD(P) transhydrogenase subunit alpha [Deltaproteobacteria bacterium]|nr:NAD(P) transhydrogenase subunit alpha [Deltaproteobacteria bacterium]
MRIGVPKEILKGEKRVAALPDTVARYVKMGFDVDVETDAGVGVYCSDQDYEKGGAHIVYKTEDIYAKSNIVLKVKQPWFNDSVGKHEVEMLKKGGVLITFLHPAAPANHDVIRMLKDRYVTSFTMDGIPRISRAQKMDALTSMSMISGYRSVLLTAINLPKLIPLVSTSLGTIKPANFLVVGAGVVGLQAIAVAKRLGGIIKVIDIREDARKGAGSLGAKVAGFDVPAEFAVGEGDYAKALPAEWLDKERAVIEPLVAEADAVILSALVPGEIAPVLITEQMVRTMKPGSVVVDVSIDQGGNCALTEPGREVVKHGVMIIGAVNIPGSVPVHASWLYANNMANYIENLYKKGINGEPDWDDEIVKSSLVTHQGKILHAGTLKAMASN